ncbi:hypothetical protein BDU57DRAFT_523865 [Ampelomyces quisqualis]|uniref:Uncharacterized protein n=1 Tax=Ampelomyces quisqualis TaxID=50730 RepID=A0A6A5QC22_AMPQU|nr:hypothetical protein BDU57DRAFT_523865 [Ampelomyces quisqualis]
MLDSTPRCSQAIYFSRLHSHILTQLPAAYARHASSHTLKSFSIRMTVHRCTYAATAVAELGLPISLADEYGVVLQDEFIEVHSECNALDALERLMDEVERRIEEGMEWYV